MRRICSRTAHEAARPVIGASCDCRALSSVVAHVSYSKAPFGAFFASSFFTYGYWYRATT